MPKFTVLCNNDYVKSYRITDPVISIGRLPENTISIANMGVSRRHVRIERDGDNNYILSDLNSLNGSLVNSIKVKKKKLSNTDRITIGKYTIIFEEKENTAISAVQEPTVEAEPSANTPDDSKPKITDTLHLENQKATASMPVLSDLLEEDVTIEKPVSELPIDHSASAAPELPIQDLDSIQKDVISGSSTPGVLIETEKHVIYKLEKPLTSIGSSESDDIFATGSFIGENHVTVEHKESELWLTCHNMLGKVKVNGKKIKSHHLQHKDRIEIGKSTFRYMENG